MPGPDFIERTIEQTLKANQGLSALCGKNVFALKIPQGTKLPAVVYQRTHSRPDYTLTGYASEAVTIMINCFAIGYPKAKQLALAVRAAMAGHPLNAVLQNETDLYEENAEVFCVSAEYLCQQSGGYCYGGL